MLNNAYIAYYIYFMVKDRDIHMFTLTENWTQVIPLPGGSKQLVSRHNNWATRPNVNIHHGETWYSSLWCIYRYFFVKDWNKVCWDISGIWLTDSIRLTLFVEWMAVYPYIHTYMCERTWKELPWSACIARVRVKPTFEARRYSLARRSQVKIHKYWDSLTKYSYNCIQ